MAVAVVMVLFNLCGTPSLPVCPVLNLEQKFPGIPTSTWQLVLYHHKASSSNWWQKILVAQGKKLAMA